MATSDRPVSKNQFDATQVHSNGTAKSYGKHTIPRPSIQQGYSRGTRKEDENHLVYRREDEKENETESTGTGEGEEVKLKNFLFQLISFLLHHKTQFSINNRDSH